MQRSKSVNWFHCNTQTSRTSHRDRTASASQVRAVFDQEHRNLYWIALVITGDPLLAEKSIVDARELNRSSNGVFCDWLTQWAYSATARTATGTVRALIRASAETYSGWTCEHSDHAPLSGDQVATLQQLDPRKIIAGLDPLARSVLVLRGVQHASISDCSLLLDVSRRSVTGAYCHGFNWLREHTQLKDGSDKTFVAKALVSNEDAR